MEIDDKLYADLVRVGIIKEENDETRNYNVGGSNYPTRLIQPWSIWIDWCLNPWEADIVKRVADRGKGEPRELDLKKIIHDCQEMLRQLECGKRTDAQIIDLGE